MNEERKSERAGKFGGGVEQRRQTCSPSLSLSNSPPLLPGEEQETKSGRRDESSKPPNLIRVRTVAATATPVASIVGATVDLTPDSNGKSAARLDDDRERHQIALIQCMCTIASEVKCPVSLLLLIPLLLHSVHLVREKKNKKYQSRGRENRSITSVPVG